MTVTEAGYLLVLDTIFPLCDFIVHEEIWQVLMVACLL